MTQDVHLSDSEIRNWQEITKEPGELVSIWEWQKDTEMVAIVLSDDVIMQHLLRKRVLTILVDGRTLYVAPYELFPVGQAKFQIPF